MLTDHGMLTIRNMSSKMMIVAVILNLVQIPVQVPVQIMVQNHQRVKDLDQRAKDLNKILQNLENLKTKIENLIQDNLIWDILIIESRNDDLDYTYITEKNG